MLAEVVFTLVIGPEDAMEIADLFDKKGDAILLRVHVQPGAGRSAVVGRHGSSLKVRVAAAPEAGRANDACARLLIETLGIKAAQLELISGATNRAKVFRVSGLDEDEFRQHLERAMAGQGQAGGPGSRRTR